jgi:hypothetical protein
MKKIVAFLFGLSMFAYVGIADAHVTVWPKESQVGAPTVSQPSISCGKEKSTTATGPSTTSRIMRSVDTLSIQFSWVETGHVCEV